MPWIGMELIIINLMAQGKRPSSGRRWSSCAQLSPSRASCQHNGLLFSCRRGMFLGLLISSHLSKYWLEQLCFPQVYSLKHDITDVQCLMPGLLLAIRKIVRIKVTISFILQASCFNGYSILIIMSSYCRTWCMGWRNFYKHPCLISSISLTLNLNHI